MGTSGCASQSLGPPYGKRRSLPPLAEAVAEEVLQVWRVVDLLDRRLHVVLDPAVLDRVVVEHHVARPPVAVARLADAADVAQRLAAVELIGAVDLLGAEELHVLGEDAGDVRVTLEAISLHQSEDSFHLALVVHILREDVLVERVAGAAVDEQVAVLAVAARPLGEELPPLLALRPRVGGGFELRPRPEDRLL